MLPIQCSECKNYLKNNKCKAFQDGIPFKIISSQINHNKPMYNQKNKIIWEKRLG